MNIAEPRSDDSDLESEELDFDDGEPLSTGCVKIFVHLPKNWSLVKVEPRSMDVASPEEEGELDFDDGE